MGLVACVQGAAILGGKRTRLVRGRCAGFREDLTAWIVCGRTAVKGGLCGARKIGEHGLVESNVARDDYFARGEVQTTVAFVL